MQNETHEAAILANIEELNFCYECNADLHPDRDFYSTCHDCGRSFCGTCSRCACDAVPAAA
jgi:hypothetical protein